MPDKRLAKAREGYEGYVYEPPKPPAPMDLTGATFEVDGVTWTITGPAMVFETDGDPGDETPWAV